MNTRTGRQKRKYLFEPLSNFDSLLKAWLRGLDFYWLWSRETSRNFRTNSIRTFLLRHQNDQKLIERVFHRTSWFREFPRKRQGHNFRIFHTYRSRSRRRRHQPQIILHLWSKSPTEVEREKVFFHLALILLFWYQIADALKKWWDVASAPKNKLGHFKSIFLILTSFLVTFDPNVLDKSCSARIAWLKNCLTVPLRKNWAPVDTFVRQLLMAVVVVALAEQSLQTPEIRGLKPGLSFGLHLMMTAPL